tara:strand:+ start:88 stop:453 length:366 start_codon:yes stop_codon:yes gene_type:complete
MNNRDNLLARKSYDFSISVINIYKDIINVNKEYVLSKQLLRSGTAIGALIHESEFAQSKPDFISKLSISLKEANETKYWLALLNDTNYIDDNQFRKLNLEVQELIAILVASIKTAKKSLNR